MARVIPALCSCYASFTLLLPCCYSAAILLLSCCYPGFIPGLFFYAVLYAALYSVLYARQQTTTTSTAAPTSSSNKTQNDPKQRQRNQGTEEHGQTSRPGRGRWCLITSPPVPCVLCLAEAAEEEPVGRPTRPPGRSPGHRPSLRAPPPRARHSFDGQIPFTPRAALATTPRSASSRSRPPHRRSQSPPLASSLDSTTAISCRAGAVSRYTLPFLRRAPLRLANGGAGQQRSSTDHHHDTTAHLCV